MTTLLQHDSNCPSEGTLFVRSLGWTILASALCLAGAMVTLGLPSTAQPEFAASAPSSVIATAQR